MDSKYSILENRGLNGKSVNGFQAKRKLSECANSINSSNKVIKLSLKTNLENGNSIQRRIYPSPGILDKRDELPVVQVRRRFLEEVEKSDTLIVIGETGSGKTTQIPQFLYDGGFAENGMIGVTQPRRVAAITISTRVAKERSIKLGGVVGYTVRFEDVTSPQTRMKFMTDGSLLREALSDRLLSSYEIIILDEAHERTINTDVLFGIVKQAQIYRQQNKMTALKIIIMSATMDVDHFSKYFNNCKVIYIKGRAYDVKMMYTEQQNDDYMDVCLRTMFDVHQKAPVGQDILMFLTGQEEIDGMVSNIKAIAKLPECKGPPLKVLPLYAQLAQFRQMEVFQPALAGYRKVIICTNIAETSLTINGIKCVIDCGKVKQRTYDHVTGLETLRIVDISQNQGWQRTGRAGRESAGICYRAYTKEKFNSLEKSTLPEILRSNISSTILQLLALGIDVKTFDFIDPPSADSIDKAINQLKQLGAIEFDKHSTQIELTQLGNRMSKFPLDPRFSKIIISAEEYGCVEEMLMIIAILSGESIFHLPTDKRVEALTAHAKFHSDFGDHITALNIFKGFESVDNSKVWALNNFLNNRNLSYAKEVRNQLKDICSRLYIPMSSTTDTTTIRKCLLTGLFNNIAELHQDKHYVTMVSRIAAQIHPSSVLNGKEKSKLILFTELVATGRNYMRTVSTIEADWVEEAVPNCSFINRLPRM